MVDESTGSEASDEDKAKQRRANPRATCSFKVRCITTKKQEFMAKATNIAIGGIQVKMPVQIPKGDKLYMEILGFHKGEKQIIKVVGISVHSHLLGGSQMFDGGFKFATALKDSDAAYIKKYVKDMLTR